MVTLNNPYLYLKGTCNVNVTDPATGDVVFQSSKVATNNFTTECDMGEIRAGLGNPIAIQLPSDAAVNLELTTADFNMQARAMQVGSQLSYNAVVPTCETITATGTSLAVTGNAVANYGMDKAYAYVNYAGSTTAGKAYEVVDGTVQGFAATTGTVYNVIYYVKQVNAQQLAISGLFAPGVYHVTAQMAVFSTEGGNANNRGSQVGWAYYIIPRMQFSGDASTNGNQTENATTALTGTALSYEEAAAAGTCTDCSFPMLAYMTYVPLSTAGNGIQGLAVVGGGVTVAVQGKAAIPVKYIMTDGSAVQPDYSKLTFTSNAPGTATVDNGIVTGVATGSTTIDISGGEEGVTRAEQPTYKTTCTVTVTGS